MPCPLVVSGQLSHKVLLSGFLQVFQLEDTANPLCKCSAVVLTSAGGA